LSTSGTGTEGRVLHSAGGVIYRRGGGGVEVCLIQPRRERWALPKGMIERGEGPPEAALREVREETGLNGEIEGPLGQLSYFFFAGGSRVRKNVDFFLMRFIDGNTDDHDGEVLEARWFPIDEAERRLAYANERRILQDAAAQIATPKSDGGGSSAA
jgi:8-oxo-dGTP pyrophosphatase MutT (NUDIX family)